MRARLLVALAAGLMAGSAPQADLGEVWCFPTHSKWVAVRSGQLEGDAWAIGKASWVYQNGGRVPWYLIQASVTFKGGNKVEVCWSCGTIRCRRVTEVRLNPRVPGRADLKCGGSLRLVGRHLQLDMPTTLGLPGTAPVRLSCSLERAK